MTKKLTDMEIDVINQILEGDSVDLRYLRKQIEIATVKGRSFTGCGFYTYFTVPESAPPIPHKPDFHVGNIIISMNELCHGAGFVLYVKGGVLDCLEAYSFNEPWPEKISGYNLRKITKKRISGAH